MSARDKFGEYRLAIYQCLLMVGVDVMANKEFHNVFKKLIQNYVNAKTEALTEEKIRLKEELENAESKISSLTRKIDKLTMQR